MPFANEHAARQNDPDKYVRLRRQNNVLGPGIHVIWGVLPSDSTEIQSIRFDSSRWTVNRARAWLVDHKFKSGIERATG